MARKPKMYRGPEPSKSSRSDSKQRERDRAEDLWSERASRWMWNGTHWNAFRHRRKK